MKHAVIALVIALGLSGCDAMEKVGSYAYKMIEDKDNPPSTTLVIHSGYTMIMGGQRVEVFGRDKCPQAGKPLFSSDVDETVMSCVVIAPDTQAVTVAVQLPIGVLKVETWTVERKEDRVMLRRADGSLLAAAQ